MAEFYIPQSEQDSRLDRAIRRRFAHIKQVQIEKSLRSGMMRLDGMKAKPNTRCQAGQCLTLPDWMAKPDKTEQGNNVRPNKSALPSAKQRQADKTFIESLIIKETKNWIAFNKPAGLAVQGGTSTGRHIDGLLQSAYGEAARPKLVHRLDKDTSGLLLVANTAQAARQLAAAFQAHDIQKSYIALVLGQLPNSGDIKVPLLKSGAMGKEKMSPDYEDGQFAHTRFLTLARYGKKMSLMALRPMTGRTHQLRVHLLSRNAPILGDGKYAGAQAHPGGDFARQLHLHAHFLDLPHEAPLFAPLPHHLISACRYLELSNAVPDVMPDFDNPVL